MRACPGVLPSQPREAFLSPGCRVRRPSQLSGKSRSSPALKCCRPLRGVLCSGREQHAGPPRAPSSIRSYSVDASEVADLHVISYEVERDLTPLILSNCQYQVVQGGESLQELDLERIQRQVIGRFLQGKPRLRLRGLPTLVYRQDWNYEHLFAAIRSRMPQVSSVPLSLGAPFTQATPTPGVSFPKPPHGSFQRTGGAGWRAHTLSPGAWQMAVSWSQCHGHVADAEGQRTLFVAGAC